MAHHQILCESDILEYLEASAKWELMIRKNKDGRPIFSETTWRRLLAEGKKLEELGYKERHSNQNLFFKKIALGYLYADLRGTEEVPIWEDTRPLLYFYPLTGTSVTKDEENNLLLNESKRLTENGCDHRFSFYAIMKSDGLFYGDDEVA